MDIVLPGGRRMHLCWQPIEKAEVRYLITYMVVELGGYRTLTMWMDRKTPVVLTLFSIGIAAIGFTVGWGYAMAFAGGGILSSVRMVRFL